MFHFFIDISASIKPIVFLKDCRLKSQRKYSESGWVWAGPVDLLVCFLPNISSITVFNTILIFLHLVFLNKHFLCLYCIHMNVSPVNTKGKKLFAQLSYDWFIFPLLKAIHTITVLSFHFCSFWFSCLIQIDTEKS